MIIFCFTCWSCYHLHLYHLPLLRDNILIQGHFFGRTNNDYLTRVDFLFHNEFLFLNHNNNKFLVTSTAAARYG